MRHVKKPFQERSFRSETETTNKHFLHLENLKQKHKYGDTSIASHNHYSQKITETIGLSAETVLDGHHSQLFGHLMTGRRMPNSSKLPRYGISGLLSVAPLVIVMFAARL
ncbi:hypothetical protein CDAR_415601 [Caerostris darwini]|uniref:Uncharacterized protein n=1 Tax=Caerostris darwini TaxID=1538125 RepID=A0AAV4Q4X4_9ARAC|nr:hypothetical protein CDAR_415601 [Caerostris darwini]